MIITVTDNELWKMTTFVYNFVQKPNASAQRLWQISPIFALIFQAVITQYSSLPCLYQDPRKSQMAKKSNQGGGGILT